VNVAELTIIGVYIFFVVPAVLVSLIWAAMLDGRYYAQRHDRAAGRAGDRAGRCNAQGAGVCATLAVSSTGRRRP
jgi:hypothetical protein